MPEQPSSASPGAAGPGRIAASAKTIMIIHGAFIAASLIYLGVYAMGLLGEPQTGKAPLYLVLAAAALGSAVMGFILPFPSLQQLPGLTGVQMRMILMDACFESVCVYGLIGVFLDMPAWMSYALMLAGFTLMAASTGWVLGWIETARREPTRRA